MPYGIVKVDQITFTNAGVDQTISVSGIVASISGNITATGTISGNVIRGGTLVSGATVTGTAGQFGTITGNTAGFTTVTGTTVTGTTANFVTVSGTTVTGATAQFTTVTGGTAGFTTVTGTTVTGTTANFVTVSGTTVTGNVGNFTTVTGGSAGFTTVTGTTITGTTLTVASGTFTGNSTAAAFIPTGSTVPTNGVYLPSANNVAISTNGTGRLFVDASGRVGVGTSSPATPLEVNGTGYVTDLLIRNNSGTPSLGTSPWLYSPASGTLAIATNAAERLRITSAGLVGIGTTSPSSLLELSSAAASAAGGITLTNTNASGYSTVQFKNTGASGRTYTLAVGGNTSVFPGSWYLYDDTAGTARFTVDSSGRLLVGTSSTTAVSTVTLQGNSTNSAADAIIRLARGTSSPANGDFLGSLIFGDSSWGEAAYITGHRDGGTWSGTSKPGRLVFSVTRDGSASPTEALRVSSTGQITSSTDQTIDQVIVKNTNASFQGTTVTALSSRAASSAYFFYIGQSSNGADNEFLLRGDGQAYADGSWNGGGADYAEYFEWSDSNPDAEDRRGISVVLDGDKIREAQAGEDPIGVISGNPSVVGDAAWNKWSGKYLRDEFGTYIQEDYEVTDEDGNTVVQQRRKLNPAYDPNAEYIPREQRPEWDCVGLMGKLRIRKGQVTGSRWIKMRDISDSVEEWLVR